MYSIKSKGRFIYNFEITKYRSRITYKYNIFPCER